jgi:hypothetical protein
MSTDNEPTEASLTLLKLVDLKARCKEKQLPVSGTKAELIARLLGTAPPAKKSKTAASSSRSKAGTVTRLDKPVFQNFVQSSERDPIVIKRNAYGHFEHVDTHLVFSAQKKVVGVQVEGNPDVQPLSTTDLESVYKYHFELDPTVVIRDPVNAHVGDSSSSQARLEELYTEAVPGEVPRLYRQAATLDLSPDDDEEVDSHN